MANLPTLQYPLIQGVRHGYSSIELNFQIPGGKKVQVFAKNINYSRKRTRALVRGNHPDPIAKTRGENEYTADIELFFAEWLLLKRSLEIGWGDISFTVIVTYGENGFDTVSDQILGCTMDSVEASQSQGSDPLTRKFELNPLKIIFDDEDDLAAPLQPPAGQ
jgi:hypothetical protein